MMQTVRSRLEGRRAVVIGVGPGFGRACAELLAAEGAETHLVARSPDRILAVARNINARGGNAITCQCDVNQPEGRASLVAHLAGRPVDVLVTVVGTGKEIRGFRLEDCDGNLEPWHSAFEQIFWTPARCIRALLPNLKSAKEARVITTNSGASEMINEGMMGYSMPKAALATLVKGLAKELGPYGIRVNGVHPGVMSNANTLADVNNNAAERHSEGQREAVKPGPLGYVPEPMEVARAVLFLATSEARAITGQGLHVNCGQWFS